MVYLEWVLELELELVDVSWAQDLQFKVRNTHFMPYCNLYRCVGL